EVRIHRRKENSQRRTEHCGALPLERRASRRGHHHRVSAEDQNGRRSRCIQRARAECARSTDDQWIRKGVRVRTEPPKDRLHDEHSDPSARWWRPGNQEGGSVEEYRTGKLTTKAPRHKGDLCLRVL